MPVGEYAGVALQDTSDKWRHGGIFLLRKPANPCDPVSLNGWTTSVAGGQRAVVTCGPSAADRTAVFAEALDSANTGLDYLSATGRTHGVIVDASDDCITWWPDGSDGVVMQAQLMGSIPFNIQMTAVVTDPDGTVRPPPSPPAPISHNIFRFMRMAKTSGDLFDAYRNLFLAFECLLDDIHPHQSGREGDWFKAALATADTIVPVAQLAPAHEPDPIDWIYRNIYGPQRSGLMHAKQQRGYLLPQNAADRTGLASSLESLWRYVRELTGKHLGVTSGSAYLSSFGWAQAIDPVLRTARMFVSEDAAPVVETGEPIPLDSSMRYVEAAPSPPAASPSEPMLRTASAVFDPAQLRHMAIRRVGVLTAKEGTTPTILAFSELTGPLRLGESVSRFEVAVGLRSFSANGAPTAFSS